MRSASLALPSEELRLLGLAFRKRGCPGALAAAEGRRAASTSSRTSSPLVEGLLGSLREFRQQRGHDDREGGAPFFELESWLRAPLEPPRRICEIGLNTGDSAAAWLCAFPDADYIGFDLMQYNSSADAVSWLQATFPGRVVVVAGDTAVTLPRYAHQHPGSCDVLSIDGGHSFHAAFSDLQHFRTLARGDRHVLLMDDVRCTHWWCKPPTAAWHIFRASGTVVERGCAIDGCCVGWCWGNQNLRLSVELSYVSALGNRRCRA